MPHAVRAFLEHSSLIIKTLSITSNMYLYLVYQVEVLDFFWNEHTTYHVEHKRVL